MKATRIRTGTAVATLLLASGACVSSAGDAADGGAADVPSQQRGISLSYVVHTITIDESLEGRARSPETQRYGVAGFDLDGRATGPQSSSPMDCRHGDFFSTLDPDQNTGACREGDERGGATCVGGVDNQLPQIADYTRVNGTDLRSSYRDGLARGHIAMVVRVDGVDGSPGPTLDDPEVTVTIFRVARPMFADCALRDSPGQMYAIDEAAPGVTFAGRIVRGRLAVGPRADARQPHPTLPIPYGDSRDVLPLAEARLRVDLGVDRGTAGNLGGFVPYRLYDPVLFRYLAQSAAIIEHHYVLFALIDVPHPRVAERVCIPPNGAVSFGYGFTLLRATVSPMRVSGPQPGMCGS